MHITQINVLHEEKHESIVFKFYCLATLEKQTKTFNIVCVKVMEKWMDFVQKTKKNANLLNEAHAFIVKIQLTQQINATRKVQIFRIEKQRVAQLCGRTLVSILFFFC